MRFVRRLVVALVFMGAAVIAADPVAAFAQTSPAPSASEVSSSSPSPSPSDAPAATEVTLDGTQYLAFALIGGTLVLLSVATLVAAHGRPVRS